MGRQLPGTLSPSKVSAFKNCPLAFRFSVIDRIPEPPSPAASKGTLVHRALERLMLAPPHERSEERALHELAEAWNDLSGDPEFALLELSDEEWETFHADARRLVGNAFLIEDPTRIQPVGLEVMMSVDIDGVKVRGIIDRLEIDEDGEFVVTDYKTGRAPREGFEKSRLSGVEFYSLLCEENLGKRPARVQLLYLADPEAVISTPSPNTARGVRVRTAAVWQAVRRACATDDFRPQTGPLCNYCTFKPYCPAYGGNPDHAIELRDGMLQETLPVS